MIVFPSCLSHTLAFVLSVESIHNVHIQVSYCIIYFVTLILISDEAERVIVTIKDYKLAMWKNTGYW